MTALKEYQRLEATGLWRASAEAQRREVVVSIGEATLTVSDFQNRALAHWSLAAVERLNPGQVPALYHPDGDSGETLELGEGEAEMIAAIDKLRRAVERARPRPGRLRFLGIAAVLAAAAGLAIFWLPGAVQRHTLKVVPQIKRQEIGGQLLASVERVAGRRCTAPEAMPALGRLARRMGVRRLVVMPAGVPETLLLPGGIVLMNRELVEDHEDPAVAAGFLLAESLRAADPLGEVLAETGLTSAFRLLTTGQIDRADLDAYAETVLAQPRPPVAEAALLARFAEAQVPAAPYAYARDVTGESVLGLIEADPMAGQSPPPVLKDRDWVLLQGICGS